MTSIMRSRKLLLLTNSLKIFPSMPKEEAATITVHPKTISTHPSYPTITSTPIHTPSILADDVSTTPAINYAKRHYLEDGKWS